MNNFSAEYGNIHFLFADKDEYYTENLVKLNLNQYLNYSLRGDGFTGIFFVQPGHDERSRYIVEMGSAQSAEEYYEAEPGGLYRLLGKKTVLKESETVRADGKLIGEKYFVRHAAEDSLIKRIHYMLKNRHNGNKYAFVIPLDIFAALYGTEDARNELQESFCLDNRNSVFLLTASMKADESFQILTQNPHIFCSDLFPEMKRIFESKEEFRLYEEMKNELGDRYHVFNQLQEDEIFRLLRYIQLIEGKKSAGSEERLGDYASLLYTWYHYPDFGLEREIGLPPKRNHSLTELGSCLRREAGRVWNQMDDWIDSIRENRPEEQKLRELVTCSAAEEKEWHPVFAENSQVRRLRRGIQAIADLSHIPLYVRMHQVEQIMTHPWSDYDQDKYEGLSEMLKTLDDLQGKGFHSEKTAMRVLDYLCYSIRNREKHDAEEIFKMKCDCYEQVVRCSSMCAELEVIKETYMDRRRRHSQELQERRERLELLRKSNPLYDELARQLMEGMVDPSFVATHAPEINQEKGNLVRLDQAIKNETAFISKKQEEISYFVKCINNLELTLSELSYEKNPVILNDVLKRATQMLRTQGVEEEKTARELRAAEDTMQAVFEESRVVYEI